MHKRNDNNTMTTGTLMSPSSLASYLSVTMKTLRRWRRRGLVPFVRLPSGQYRYDLNAVERVLTRRAV